MPAQNPTLDDHVAVVIAAYNEADSIRGVVEDLRSKLPGCMIVVVNDGSKDQTAEVLARQAVHRLSHALNLGQGAALQTGIDYAVHQGARYIVTFDADGQHRSEDVPRLLEPLIENECDVALGSRFLNSHSVDAVPPIRRLLLRAATWFTRLTTGLAVTDTHNGLRAFRADCAARLEMRMNGMSHASELLSHLSAAKLRWREIPVDIRYTDYSVAKGQKASNLFNILWELFWKR
jgi:glycosyltransferase involved in cell wall biosynthesis